MTTLLTQEWQRKWNHRFLVFVSILLINSCASAQENSADVNWLIESLELNEGSVVADIGAGDGNQTLAIARYIGPDGQIYSTELGEESVQELRESVERSQLDNITVLVGDPNQTNLPEECCDAIYLRRVYHHIGDPPSMNASLLKSLKSGGRLAIIDFEPRGSEAEPGERASGSQHGVTAETVVDELTQAGFVLVSNEQQSGRNFYVIVQKPE